MAAADRWLDTEDERLTAPERQYLRQLAFRLRNGGTARSERGEVFKPVSRPASLEDAIAALFAGGK